jgi:type VI secretion system protein ImpK
MGNTQMTNDPFAFDDDDDRTVLRPSSNQGRAAPAPNAAAPAQLSTSLPPLGGINPLEKAASRLIPLLLTIRHSTDHPNPDQLRNRLIQELNEFKQAAMPILNDQKKVTQASYVMCTAMDEAVMNTPWGHKANWSQHNLLSTFHNEVVGGERFFALLKGLGKNPKDNIDLLELMYVCLSLGYEGTYRIAENGQSTLTKVQVWLYEIINSVRSAPDAALSIHWQGSGVQESRLPKMTVLWVIGAAALTLSSLVYIGYRYSLGDRSDTAIAGFFGIRPAALQVNSIVPPAAPPASSSTNVQLVTLEQLLQPQIDLNLIEVNDSFNEGQVRILGNNLFASGKTTLNTDLEPLVQAIAKAMDQFKGSILVTGHSDNVPIRSGRFASNLELSKERAISVAERIAVSLQDATRVGAEGRGSLEPIADNSSASGRARNRRVEVSIFY